MSSMPVIRFSSAQQPGSTSFHTSPTQSNESATDGSVDSAVAAATLEATPPKELGRDVGGVLSTEGQTTTPIRKFKPQLIETSRVYGGRNQPETLKLLQESKSFSSEPQIILSESLTFESTSPITSPSTITADHFISGNQESTGRRTFKPLLVETASRSRKVGDIKPALTYADRTDVTPIQESPEINFVSRRSKLREELPSPLYPAPILSPDISTTEARRVGIPLPRRSLSQSSTHSHHSFKAPGLETIESSGSDSSAHPSPITSALPSPSSISHISRASHCVDHHSTGYMLALAAKNAQRQLREQALAAFPNDDRHQPVLHYIDRGETPAPSSRGSQYDLELRRASSNWELKEVQKHHEMLELGREQERRKREARRRLHRELDEDPWKIPIETTSRSKIPGPCNEMQKMLEKARPPMLGKDLVFPRSQSPDVARFDVTQGHESLKKTMSYLSMLQERERSEPASPPAGGLWSAQASPAPPPKPESVASYTWSRPASRTPSQQAGNSGGLWGGSCVDSGLSPPSSRPTGIMTPRFDEDFGHSNPLDVPTDRHTLRADQLPPSPPPSTSGGMPSSLEERLETEAAIETEFDDRFITQVYNYLSLGYPAVARDFDEELSKISRIPISELRQDDGLTTGARGYIRLGEEELCEGITEDMCARWKALRLYIHEWARQQPGFAKSKPEREIEGKWVAARKGSWAW